VNPRRDRKKPQLNDYLDQLGLPSEFASTKAKATPSVLSQLAGFDQQRASRNFLPALVIAMVALVERVLTDDETTSEPQGLAAYEREELTAKGRHVNTLNVTTSRGSVVRLRPLYNRVQHVVVHDLRRYDFPNMPGHATQAWRQHQDMLDGLFAMSQRERRAVLDHAWGAVLEFEEFRPRSVDAASPRPFSIVLTKFPNTRSGEPAGAVLQGLAFAYYRADSPNVTIETGKVGAGSRRVGRVGDVDGWSGPDLVLSIEVKDAELANLDGAALDGFLANLGEWPDATAIVFARKASDEVVANLAAQNVAVLTRESMLEAVMRWDLNKQRLATREFYYYLSRVQRNSKIANRFEKFLKAHGIAL
jgi:hypothetical protein